MDNDSWVTGFFEGQASFAVNIGLQKTKNKRYVVFKPVINIVSVDKHQVEFIKKYFDLEMKVGKKKRKENYHNEYFSLMIQRFEDVEKILDKLSEYKFKSPIKEKKLMRFVECYFEIKKEGYMHTQWNDKFIDIIDKKLLINDTRSNIESNRYSRDEWIKRIQEHLNSI